MTSRYASTSWAAAEPAVTPDWTVGLLVAIVLVLAVIGLATVRSSAPHERLVVVRLGRVVRVRGPGLVLLVPGVERAVRVSLRVSRLHPMVVRAVTSDGVGVRAWASALYRVTEPELSAVATADPLARTAEVVEAAVRREVATSDLATLLTGSLPLGASLTDRVGARAAEWGVEVLDIETTEVELQLSSELLWWAERRARRTDLGVSGSRVG